MPKRAAKGKPLERFSTSGEKFYHGRGSSGSFQAVIYKVLVFIFTISNKFELFNCCSK